MLRLWEGPAPGSESWEHVEVAVTSFPDAPGAVRNVVVPTLEPYLPAEVPRRAVVVVPGGAFYLLSMENEGSGVAENLRSRGVAAFVLKYRVVPSPADEAEFGSALAAAFAAGMEDAIRDTLPLAVADAERAVELVRGEGFAHVTTVGFSAGGRIVAELATTSHADRRPDAAGVIYTAPVRKVPAPDDAPPLFVCAAADDPLVGVSGSLTLHEAWRAARRPVELHLFERGGHGFASKRQGLAVDRWTDLFHDWLASVTE